MHKGGYVYIMASRNKNVLYTGVTANLPQRVWEHRSKQYPESFTARYNCICLVYYQAYETIEAAIAEEKRKKAGSRRQKENLIISMNPEWKDLGDEIG